MIATTEREAQKYNNAISVKVRTFSEKFKERHKLSNCVSHASSENTPREHNFVSVIANFVVLLTSFRGKTSVVFFAHGLIFSYRIKSKFNEETLIKRIKINKPINILDRCV